MWSYSRDEIDRTVGPRAADAPGLSPFEVDVTCADRGPITVACWALSPKDALARVELWLGDRGMDCAAADAAHLLLNPVDTPNFLFDLAV